MCTGVDKTFGATKALRGVSLSVRAGSIHALVGENGAGKSTLLGVFSGRVRPDAGSMLVNGQPLAGGSPRQLRTAGLAMIYQELTMVPMLSAEENVFLGMQPSHAGFLDVKRRREAFAALAADLDVKIPPTKPVRLLSLAQQQLVEIMRGIAAKSRVLLLDEPTAALAERERELLHRVIRDLNQRGITIVFVSHNLEEVLQLSSRITVMRDGAIVADGPTSDWTKDALITAMVGQAVEVPHSQGASTNRRVLEAKDVRVRPGAPALSLSVNEGEIVGLWGLVGSGRTTFLRSLSGLERRSMGQLWLDGRRAPWPRKPSNAQSRGICLLPESRRSALVPNMSTVDNFWIGRKRAAVTLVRRKSERDAAISEVSKFGFDTHRINSPVGRLSGGNQQKALLAKWVGHMPRVLLVDEPTRGIDVGAKAEVLSALVRLANEGTSIVMTSSELEEVLLVADRILIFADGDMVGEIRRGSPDFQLEAIVQRGFRNEAER